MAENEVAFLEHIISELLKEKKFAEILSVLDKPENEEVIKNNALNLISVVCSTLKSDKHLLERTSDIELCKDILLLLERKGNPKEVLLGLLDAADSFKEEEYFCMLLTPIQKVLQHIPGKRGKSLEWVLSTLNAHISYLTLPKDDNLTGDELLLLDLDPAVQTTAEVLRNYLDFFCPFVEEVSISINKKQATVYSDRIIHQRTVIQKYLLNLLYKPLLYQDLHIRHGKPKSAIQVCCDILMQYLIKTCCNMFTLYNFNQDLSNRNESITLEEAEYDNVPSLAIGNLAYLLFVESVAIDLRPYVFSHIYIFKKHLKFIISLLSEKRNLVLFKGLRLIEVLLRNLDDLELQSSFFKHADIIQVSNYLLNIAIYCQVEENRHLAIKIFKTYINKFDWKGRFTQLMAIVSSISHSGVQGLAINMYKDYLHEQLGMKDIQNHFVGKNLKSFLRQVLVLKDGVETDVLENSDKILSELNLIRYIILRDDKKTNATGFWDMIDLFNKVYLEELRCSIELAKAHYELETKNVKENKQTKDKTIINNPVTVNNEIMPNLSSDYKMDVLNKAVISLDVIESVLFRIKEILET